MNELDAVKRETPVAQKSGLVSASALAMILVGIVSGAVAGLILSNIIRGPAWLAIVAAFVATILAFATGHAIVRSRASFSVGAGVVVWNIVMTSLIGGLAGHELSVDLTNPPSSPFIGAMSGLLAAVLIASFVFTCLWVRDRQSVAKI